MYTPVAQRKTTINPVVGGGVSPVSGGGYVPVAERIATVSTVTSTVPNQIDVNLNFGTTKSTPQFIAPNTPTPISMTGSLIKETGQGIARSLASVSLSAIKNVAKVVAPNLAPSAHLKPEDFKSFFGQALAETILGKDYNDKGIFSVKPVEQNVADTTARIKNWQKETEKLLATPGLTSTEKTVISILSNFAPVVPATVGVVGNIGLDLTGYGGLEKNVLKDMVKIGTEGDGIKLLLKLGVDEQLAKSMGIEVAKVATEKEAQGLFSSISKLQSTTKSATSIPRAYTPVAERITQPLAQEAGKYNSAEEFVKAQKSNILQHASDNPNLIKFEDLQKTNKVWQDKINRYKQLVEEQKKLKTADELVNWKNSDEFQNLDKELTFGIGKPPVVGSRGTSGGEGIYLSSKVDYWRGALEAEGKPLGKYTYDVLVTNPEKAKQYFQPSGGGQQLPETLINYNEGVVLGKSGKYNIDKKLTDIFNQSKAVGEVKPIIKESEAVVGKIDAGGISGKRGLAKVGLAPEVSPKIIRTEEQLLKTRIRDEARGTKIGYKIGQQEARESIVNQLRNTFDTKLAGIKRGNELAVLKTKIVGRDADRVRTEIVNYVKQNIPTTEQGKFITMVKNSETQNDLTKAFLRIDEKTNQIAVKDAITNLKKTTDKLVESPSVSADYRKKIKDIINQYELSGHTGATMKKLEATQSYLEGIKASGGETYIPEKILEKLQILSRVPRNKMTLSQIQGLQNEIELLGKLGQTKWASKQALYEGEKALRKQALLESATPINSLLSAKGAIGDDPKKWAEAYIKTRNYLQKTNLGLKPIDGLADITGMRPMKEALDLRYGDWISRNIPKEYNIENFKNLEEEMLNAGKNLSEGSRDKVSVFGSRMQEGGYEKLANRNITVEEADAVVLTVEEKKFWDAMQRFNDATHQPVRKYMMDTYNIDIGPKVDNYMSWQTDFEAMSDLAMYDRFGTRADEAITARRTKKVEQGFAESRVGAGIQKIQLDSLKVAQRHADDVAYMLTMGRDIKQYSEIINTPEMLGKLGDIGTLAWKQWLDLMARKGGSEGSKRLATLDWFRKNIGAGVLGFRLSSALVQFSSFADTLGTIGVEYATKGASRITTSKEWRQFILNNFPEVRKAIGDDIAFREFGDGMMGKFAKAGTKPLQMLDGIMRSVAAAGSYEKLALKRGIAVDLANPNKQLIQEATALMRQSQGSSFFKDQPLSLTTGFGLLENKSLNKFALTFQSFMLNRWDNINRQIWRMGLKEGNYKKAAASFFWMVIFAAAAEEGIRRGTRATLNFVTGDKDEEQSFAANSVLNVVQTVPIAGSLVSALTYSSNPVPVINAGEDLLTGIGTVYKGKAGSTKAKGAIQAIGATGTLLGVAGSSQAAQIIKKIIPTSNGGIKSSGSSSKKLKTPAGLPSLPKFQLPTPPGLPKLPKL